jgi:hypothetical protein
MRVHWQAWPKVRMNTDWSMSTLRWLLAKYAGNAGRLSAGFAQRRLDVALPMYSVAGNSSHVRDKLRRCARLLTCRFADASVTVEEALEASVKQEAVRAQSSVATSIGREDLLIFWAPDVRPARSAGNRRNPVPARVVPVTPWWQGRGPQLSLACPFGHIGSVSVTKTEGTEALAFI